jgi:hypothetical protein
MGVPVRRKCVTREKEICKMLEKGLLIYLLINVLVCILYGIDKWKAVHHRWRIPESTLMLSAVFGVFGAFIGMHWFHHKTHKPKFYIGVPVIFVLELLCIIGLFIWK